MTRFSGGFGPRFDGNSLLVKLEDENTYLHIGRDLVTFRTKSPVTEYVSPVGNNDVPYPYAVDEQGNYYLVIESVILLAKPGLDEEAEGRGNDPYTYYYNLALMSTDLGRTPPRQAVGGLFHNIKYFTVGQEQYTMTYHTDPDETYDRLTKQDGGQMMLHYNDGTAEEIDRDQYADLMEEFAELRGFEAMDIVSTTEH
jgi:hypothetical protein